MQNSSFFLTCATPKLLTPTDFALPEAFRSSSFLIQNPSFLMQIRIPSARALRPRLRGCRPGRGYGRGRGRHSPAPAWRGIYRLEQPVRDVRGVSSCGGVGSGRGAGAAAGLTHPARPASRRSRGRRCAWSRRRSPRAAGRSP